MQAERRILIVDDERNIRRTVECALRDAGFCTGSAATGEEALACLEAEDFALVLLDLRLPGLSGIDVLRRLRAASKDVPVIVITAYGTVETAVEAMRLGATDVVEKPFTPERLREAVKQAIERPSEPAEGLYEARMAEAAAALARHDHGGAMAAARRAVGLAPDRGAAFNLIGVVLAAQGEVTRAQDFFRAALAVDPTFVPARDNLEVCASSGGVGTRLELGNLPPGGRNGR